MRFAWLSVVAAAAAGLACGCGDLAPVPSETPKGVAGSDATIAFDVDGTLALAPTETAVLRVETSPPATYEIAFTVLGDALDATLDHAVTIADADGVATVRLRAPSEATTFRLRATLKDGPFADVGVSVSDRGFGTLRVVPEYAGSRPVERWVAGAVARSTCADLAPILPGEAAGALTGSAEAGSPIEIAKAPVGPSLAITVRAGHYVVGCVDETGLIAGSQLDVRVPVLNVPMRLDATSLDLTLAFAPDPPWKQLVFDATTLLLDAFMPTSAPPAATLLDAMEQELAGNDLGEFQSRRADGDWDSVVTEHLGPLDLRAKAESWVSSGIAPSLAGLLGHLSATGSRDGNAALSVTSLAAIDASELGIPSPLVVAWNADPDDTVHLAGAVPWLPSRFMSAAARAGAKADLSLPSNATVVDAIERLVDCTQLGVALGSPSPCASAVCVAPLCRSAIATLWTAGADASVAADRMGEIEVSAAGAGLVDDEAAVSSFQGGWVGTVTDGVVEAPVSGDARGVEPGPPH